MMLRVAVNGFGRIGRSAFKVAIEKHSDEIEIVGINDLTSPATLAHLLKYDSAYGVWDHEVSSDDSSTGSGHIIVDQNPYTVYQEKEPARLPWKDLNVDVVIESTGKFTDAEGMKQHLLAGAKKVVLSAPAKGEGVKTLLIGVNAQDYKGETLVNNASCTTNCIAPVVDVINNKFGIAKAYMTTIHAYTQDQSLQDGPHKDLRRARAAAVNMIPTSTGAAVATTEVIPALKGLFDGMSMRVPIIVGSISDITFLLKKKVTVEEVNEALRQASQGELKNIMAVTDEPIVSADIVGRSESAIVDLGLTQVVDGDFVKVFAWYDNEWGYSNRLIEQVINVGKA
ncbi:MAG: type I glyceraldehyde-3-phosphate dehydrogenase [Candidatus Daviesbacteria bacterium]|nr:type I glyceraldehyde-3-phosphate dehydrogenase [Candidatus Daviesbacteria bacterium]